MVVDLAPGAVVFFGEPFARDQGVELLVVAPDKVSLQANRERSPGVNRALLGAINDFY